MTTELEQKIAEQAAVIEKLRDVLGEGVGSLHKFSDGFECRCSQCNFVRLKAKALAIPTDSKQILSDWLDSVLGEPELHAYKNTGQYAVVNADDSDSRVIALFKKPEIK